MGPKGWRWRGMGRRGDKGEYENKWRRGWLRMGEGAVSIIVINTITINAAETSSVRSSSELGFLLLHFYRDQAFPATVTSGNLPGLRIFFRISAHASRVRSLSSSLSSSSSSFFLSFFLSCFLLVFPRRDCRMETRIFLSEESRLQLLFGRAFASLCRSPRLFAR